MIENIIIFILSLYGFYVCRKKFYTNNIFKYGMWFFILNVWGNGFDLLNNFVIIPLLIKHKFSPLGCRLVLLDSISIIIQIVAFYLIIRGFKVSKIIVESDNNK